MGHDVHFLSRLERVEGPALNLALGLYRDSEMVKWVMRQLPLGDADVVALPLTSGDAPPHALVSRKGKFITCLGAGMHPNAARVTWTQLDLVTGQLEAWREVEAKGQERAVAVLRRMMLAGPWLSREDYEDLEVVAAVEWGEVGRILGSLGKVFPDVRVRFRPRLFEPLDAGGKKSLSASWKSAWGASHASLVLVESWLAQEPLRSEMPWEPLIAMASMPTLSGLDGHLVRAGWCIGRLGPRVIPELVERLRDGLEPDEPGTFREPGVKTGDLMPRYAHLYGLVAIAARVPDALPVVREHLLRMVPPEAMALCADLAPDAVPNVLFPARYTSFTTAVVTALHHLNEADRGFPTSLRRVIGIARDFYNDSRRDAEVAPVYGPRLRVPHKPSPRPPGEKGKTAEEVLEALGPERAFVPSFALTTDLYVHSELYVYRMHLVPQLASRAPAELFFTQARLDDLAKNYIMTTPVEYIRDLLTKQYKTDDIRQPVKVVATPGRNDVCSCGSGAKYKKCCGR